MLQAAFARQEYPSAADKVAIASEAGLEADQVGKGSDGGGDA